MNELKRIQDLIDTTQSESAIKVSHNLTLLITSNVDKRGTDIALIKGSGTLFMTRDEAIALAKTINKLTSEISSCDFL